MNPNSIELFNQILEQGRHRFGDYTGIISHIEGDVYQVMAVNPDNTGFSRGDRFDLKDTYCREVFSTAEPVAITRYQGKAGLVNHPLYNTVQIEAYISAPIHHQGQVWGTLNFSSMDIRENDFSQDDQRWMVEQAEKLSASL